MYKHLFGPVPSRRLGISLGIDLVPHKTCSLDCIYCECGETTELTVERKEYVPVDEVLSELEDYFKNNPDPDYITFSGAGEPTLNSRIGDVVEFIRQKKPDISIAVLTNGTLLGQKEVRDALLGADLVMPSLDGATVASLKSINRPHPSIDIDSYIQGLSAFRKEFKGKFCLEIFILPGTNNSTPELTALKAAAVRIKPDLIQINTLDRPGVIAGIHAADRKELKRIADFFHPLPAEVIAKVPDTTSQRSYRNDMEAAIHETVLRRPCTPEDLAAILGAHINEIQNYLNKLEESGQIEAVHLDRGVFYQAKNKFSDQ